MLTDAERQSNRSASKPHPMILIEQVQSTNVINTGQFNLIGSGNDKESDEDNGGGTTTMNAMSASAS